MMDTWKPVVPNSVYFTVFLPPIVLVVELVVVLVLEDR